MRNPYYAAKDSTFAEFMDHYDRDEALNYRGSGGRTTLLGAMRNVDPAERCEIANKLLDDGADASAISQSDNVNALHVLFGHRIVNHNLKLEAPLLKRLLEGGADINLRSPKFGLPLEAMEAIAAPESELEVFYDVVFARPDIDLDASIGNDQGSTLRDLLTKNVPWGRVELERRTREYDAAHPKHDS